MQLVLAGEAPARRRYLWYVATLVDDTGVLRILHVFEMFFVFSLGRGGSRVDDRCTLGCKVHETIVQPRVRVHECLRHSAPRKA